MELPLACWGKLATASSQMASTCEYCYSVLRDLETPNLKMFPLIAIILLFYFWAHRNSLQYQAILLIIFLQLKMSCGKGYILNGQGTLLVTQYRTLRQCDLLSHNPSPAWFHSLTLFNPQAMDTRKLVMCAHHLIPTQSHIIKGNIWIL